MHGSATANGARSSPRRRPLQVGYWFRRRALLLLALLLFGLSAFFAIGAERHRASLRQSENAAFGSGDIVTIQGIIDGDELRVRKGSDTSGVVRLLGVMALDSTREQRGAESTYGQRCADVLTNEFVGKPVVLRLGDPAADRKGRLLGYVELETDQGVVDVGLNLVERGLAMVFTKYPTPREQAYLLAERAAADKGVGLWGDAEVASKVRGWQAQWDMMRRQDD